MRSVLFIVFLAIAWNTSAQKTDKKLQRKIEALVKGFNGDIGIYIKNLENGKVVAINADSIFPTASIVKIPILIGAMDKINKGELTYNQKLQYRDSLLYAGVDILGSFRDSQHIELGKVMMLMLTMSDNTASLWLQKLSGTGTRVNTILDSLGFQFTRINSRTEGRMENWRQYGWGQTTPREMATIMERISNGEMISKERSNQMLRLLGRNFWDDVSISQIPPDVFIASKNGAVNESRSEILFVNGKGARYVLGVFTKNIKDRSWNHSNEAWVLMRKISGLAWDHFSN
ncbi:MAG TPA: serine hydrolase [Flavisolibacter sp.]